MQFNDANGHVVRLRDRAMLFHVPTTALFELDELGTALVDLACTAQRETSATLAALQERFGDDAVQELIGRLTQLGVLQSDAGPLRAVNPRPAKVESYPLSTLVLNVNTGCNLGCTYCYKEDLAVPARGEKMSFDTAARGIELLLTQAAGRSQVGIVFFGGEPLTNMPLIREVVAHAEERARAAGKRIDFSLTTNATLFTPALIEYFDAHRFGISVSIDGPKAVHDRNRRTVGGRGTYEVVSRKVRMLLECYRSRPVGARVTLTAGTTEVEAIHEHLRSELGFHEVGYAPVTASPGARHALSDEELADVYRGFERLGMQYRRAALAGHNTGFANLHQLMTDLHEGRRKSLPCGAGVGLLALDRKGGLNLCHRFTGSELPTFGDLERGIDGARLGEFLTRASDRKGTDCATCRIRNLCAGGCYHESYVRYGDPHHRTYHYCDLLRRWVDFGIGVYAEISACNPSFFSTHIEPRRAIA